MRIAKEYTGTGDFFEELKCRERNFSDFLVYLVENQSISGIKIKS